MKRKREGTVSEYITEAMLALVKKKPYEDISITELCAKAGVTRMSFYRNYSDRDDIFRQMIRQITDRFLEESGISYSSDSTEQYLVKLFAHMKAHQKTLELISRAGLLSLIRDEFERTFPAVHRNDYDEYKSCFHAGGMFNVFRLWLDRGCLDTPEELAHRLKNLLEK